MVFITQYTFPPLKVAIIYIVMYLAETNDQLQAINILRLYCKGYKDMMFIVQTFKIMNVTV